MTTPSPTPSAGTVNGIPIVLPPSGGSTSSTGDLYGLADWGKQTVNPGDLPFMASLVSSNKTITGDAIVKAFASADPVAIAEVQRALYLGGFYGRTSTYVPTYGQLSAEDVTAFGDAVKLAGQSAQSVSDLLLQHAKVGTLAGIDAAAQQAKVAKTVLRPHAYTIPSTGDLEAEAVNAFENILGRRAKPAEAARFAAFYTAMVAGVERGNIAAEQAAIDREYGINAGGLSQGQQRSFAQQLDQIGKPEDVGHGAAATPESQWWRGGLPGPLDGPNTPAWVQQNVTPGFGEQMGQLMSLGQAVNAATSASGGSVTPGQPNMVAEQQPEAVSVAAANFARNEHPKQAAATDMGTAIDTFMQLLGSKLGA